MKDDYGDILYDNGQELTILPGKIFRIDVNPENDSAYVIPSYNPFNDDQVDIDELYVCGLRNLWRNSFE